MRQSEFEAVQLNGQGLASKQDVKYNTQLFSIVDQTERNFYREIEMQ
jgi:hypothetical protein